MDNQKVLIVFAPDDNVAIALSDLLPGETYLLLSGEGGTLGELSIAAEQPVWLAGPAPEPPIIRHYYKVATRHIPRHEPIIKDRVPIGEASEEIQPGQVVHQVFRARTGGFERIGGNIREYPNAFSPPASQLETLAAASRITTAGLIRPSHLRPRRTIPTPAPVIASASANGLPGQPLPAVGRGSGDAGGPETLLAYERGAAPFGSRNHLLVIPSVFCVNQEAGEIADSFATEAWGDQGENRVIALPHATGCCQVGYDEEVSLRLLANMIAHPNVGAAVIVTLGCSPLCVQDRLLRKARTLTDKPIQAVSVQALGRAAALARGKEAVAALLPALQRARRSPQPLDELLLAVKCGASDLTSGLFANTATGHVADLVLDQGGSVVISEIMEFFGAEKALKSRCRDQSVWLDLLRLIKTNEMIGKAAAALAEQDIHSMELTMGNIEAGLSTQEEKSLGAIRKMGFKHPIENVVGFAERLADARAGLYVMDGPGQDLISASGLGATGAQAMIFTTGIGNPLGNALTPVIKVTGNRETAARQPDFIDLYIPLVELLQQGLSAPAAARQCLWAAVVMAIEGRPTLAERNRHRDFASRGYAMVQ
ncbi:MAG: UxaA family hydrolase [Chromatiaceae bacterium]|nr:UxaA family hydrolase [Candidatus Thioaporhodococcus sediminis]